MGDYDKPTIPANTPPVIDPKVRPETSAQTDADGERESEATDQRDDDARVEVEKALAAAQEGGRDGDGEAALDEHSHD